ncbi:hypothetical protein SLA2020_506000 [Shorea laevis]
MLVLPQRKEHMVLGSSENQPVMVGSAVEKTNCIKPWKRLARGKGVMSENSFSGEGGKLKVNADMEEATEEVLQDKRCKNAETEILGVQGELNQRCSPTSLFSCFYI